MSTKKNPTPINTHYPHLSDTFPVPTTRSLVSSHSPSPRRSGARSLTPNLPKEAQLGLQAEMLPVMPRVVQGLDPSQESLLGLLETSARIVNIVAPPGFGVTQCSSTGLMSGVEQSLQGCGGKSPS